MVLQLVSKGVSGKSIRPFCWKIQAVSESVKPYCRPIYGPLLGQYIMISRRSMRFSNRPVGPTSYSVDFRGITVDSSG